MDIPWIIAIVLLVVVVALGRALTRRPEFRDGYDAQYQRSRKIPPFKRDDDTRR